MSAVVRSLVGPVVALAAGSAAEESHSWYFDIDLEVLMAMTVLLQTRTQFC